MGHWLSGPLTRVDREARGRKRQECVLFFVIFEDNNCR